MPTVEVLYTPAILGLASSLADWPLNDGLPLQSTARSKSCGSSLTLGLALDGEGRIARVGLKTHACAIGQAAAALFAAGAAGKDAAEIAAMDEGLRTWLTGEGPRPDWPGIDMLEPARAYPARHGAIGLAWRAARDLLPSG
jgi:NifU-like protein involved in Fe-S cluster formation